MFVQVVAVAPDAQRRGVGLALLTVVAKRGPARDIVLAIYDDDIAPRALIDELTKSIGASGHRVNLGIYRDRDLSIKRGEGHRVWVISSGVEPEEPFASDPR